MLHIIEIIFGIFSAGFIDYAKKIACHVTGDTTQHESYEIAF
jgi:hypothetical protein